MNGTFTINIITPLKVFEREIRYIRLRDETGFFGVMKGHADFLTILVPSLGYYNDKSGKETFIAVDGGIFSVRGGIVTLISREAFESEDAEKLGNIIDGVFAGREESETAFSGMIQGIEKSFIQKTAEFIRGKA